MKYLIILICLLPLVGAAQETAVRSNTYPSQPSIFFENRQQVNGVPGTDEKKLFAVIKQWFSGKFKVTDTTKSAYTLIGTGTFSGSYTYHGDSPEKSNIAPVNYDVNFTIMINVSEEKYHIYISNFILNIISVTGQNPEFLGYTGTQPAVHNGPFKTDINELYTNIRESITLRESSLFKNASKYILKAQKKGLL
jgi:hypothetical protein